MAVAARSKSAHKQTTREPSDSCGIDPGAGVPPPWQGEAPVPEASGSSSPATSAEAEDCEQLASQMADPTGPQASSAIRRICALIGPPARFPAPAAARSNPLIGVKARKHEGSCQRTPVRLHRKRQLGPTGPISTAWKRGGECPTPSTSGGHSVVSRLRVGAKLAYGIGQVAEQVKSRGFDIFVFFYFNQILGLEGWMTGCAVTIALLFDAVKPPRDLQLHQVRHLS